MRKMKNLISVILFVSTTHLFPPKVLCQDSSVNISYKKIGVDNKDIKNIENILLNNGVEKNFGSGKTLHYFNCKRYFESK